MEITSFVLGMLTIVAVIIVTAIVVGMVKISKLTKEQDSLQQLCAAIEGDLRREIENVYNNICRENEDIRRIIEDTLRNVYNDMNSENDNIRRIIEDTHRDINMVEKTIMNQINQLDEHHHKVEDEIHRDIDETRRYIDSRIDKVVTKGTLDSSKQVIKG